MAMSMCQWNMLYRLKFKTKPWTTADFQVKIFYLKDTSS